jgi:hypothetical protein
MGDPPGVPGTLVEASTFNVGVATAQEGLVRAAARRTGLMR